MELAANDPLQTSITDYYKVIEDIERLVFENKILTMLLQQHSIQNLTQNSNISSSLTPVLKKILLNAEANTQKYPKQCRHIEIVIKFATALFSYCGPLSYEFIQQNMQKALPCL